MNNLHRLQEASLGGQQWFGGSVMEFDFGNTFATVYPPDRLSPRWLVVTPVGDFWADSLAEVLDGLLIYSH